MSGLWLPDRPAEASQATPLVVPGTAAGTVAVCAGETARYSAFAASLAQLELPPGWSVRFYLGSDLVAGRNRAVRELATEWLLFMDDDHTIPPDLIRRLLAHERDIVGCLHADRDYPCVEPVAGPPGLREVDVVGAPGMLVHRRVLDALGLDPFRREPDEDYWLCRDALEAGFSVWQDTSVTLAHITPALLTPEYADGRWQLRVQIGGTDFLLDQRAPGQADEEDGA